METSCKLLNNIFMDLVFLIVMQKYHHYLIIEKKSYKIDKLISENLFSLAFSEKNTDVFFFRKHFLSNMTLRTCSAW